MNIAFFSTPRVFDPYTTEFQELLRELKETKAKWWIKPAAGYNGPIIGMYQHPTSMRGLVLPDKVEAVVYTDTDKGPKASRYTHADPTIALKNAFELWLFAKCEVLV